MLFKVHAELFRKAFPLYGSELGFSHPALPKRIVVGINEKYQKKKKKKKKDLFKVGAYKQVNRSSLVGHLIAPVRGTCAIVLVWNLLVVYF